MFGFSHTTARQRFVRGLMGAGAAMLAILPACGPIDLFPDDQSQKPPPGSSPEVSSVMPNVGSIAGGTEVTIVGQNFGDGMEVLFGGFLGLDVKVVNLNTITAVTPAQASGKVDVVVRDTAGNTAKIAQGFEYTNPVTPPQGSMTGGTSVTILGQGFPASGMVVLFDSVAATNVNVLSSSVLTAVTPPHSPGFVNVVLKPGGGDIVLPSAFQYVTSAESEGGPRLVSAVSTSNSSVLVTFNEAVGDGADVAANYNIVQAKVNSEAGKLIVQAAAVSPDRVSVVLTTASQNEVTYELRVTGIKDLAGNPLAAPSLLLDPTRTQFTGTPPVAGPGGLTDSDGDGLPDNVEQYGRLIIVKLQNGQFVTHTVTSDPFVVDTDADGLNDAEEKAIGSNPRSADTDADGIADAEEWNEWFSDPNQQDTDGDGFSDALDIYFRTSPVLADTDGDQMSDSVEIIERNRNPLLSDLPLPQITVDGVRLDLKITSSYTDEKGVTKSVADATSASFTQSRSDTIGRSDTNSTQSENSFGQKLGAEVSYGKDGFGGKVTAEASFGQKRTRGFSSTVNSETARASQQAYQQSVQKALVNSERRAVTRTIDQAIVQANVNLANLSDIAFSITNIEISVQQQDRRNGRLFRPIATLRPAGATDPLSQPTYNLGPLDPERGPIIFQNVEVFPNLVDDLMREPTGLVFQVVNFDILDEFGRNFVFSSQEVNDRTAGITIDFGDGAVESYRVATASKFDAAGRALGITMQRALEIAGITRLGEAGEDGPFTPTDPLPNSIRKTYATSRTTDGFEVLTRVRGIQNDLVAVPQAEKRFWTIITSNTDLPPDIDFSTIPLKAGDDYLIVFTRDVDKDNLFEREEYLYGSSDRSTDTDADGLGDFFEVRTGWTVRKTPGLPYKTFPDPARADSDDDSLADDVEYTLGTDPNRSDTDEDGVLDAEEALATIEVVLFDGDTDDTNDQLLTITPYSSWAILDGGNGLADTAATGDDVQVIAVGDPVAPGDVVIGPGANGVLDTTPAGDEIARIAEEIVNGPNNLCETTAAGDDIQVVPTGSAATPGQVLIRAGLNGLIDSASGGDDYTRVKHATLCSTDPLNQDTDSDGIPDGREILIGTNPNTRDAGKVTDSDGDGLYDLEEDAGWSVVIYAADGSSTTRHVTSNKFRADTDLDGVPDVYEWAIRSDPRASDTDGDTLFDRDEFDPDDTDRYYDAGRLLIAVNRCAAAANCQAPTPPDLASRLRTAVHKVDSDGDGRADNVEVVLPWTVAVYGVDSYQVRSKPYEADSDKDGWNDSDEATNGTDPEKADTDGDGAKDRYEKVTRGTDPLRPDKKVTVYYTGFTVQDDCEGLGEDDGADFYGKLKIIDPSGTTTNLIELDDWGNNVFAVNFVPINPKTFIMYPGQSFTLQSDKIQEYDSASGDEDAGSFTEQVDYNSVTDGRVLTLTPTGGADSCALTIFAQIEAPLGP